MFAMKNLLKLGAQCRPNVKTGVYDRIRGYITCNSDIKNNRFYFSAIADQDELAWISDEYHV